MYVNRSVVGHCLRELLSITNSFVLVEISENIRDDYPLEYRADCGRDPLVGISTTRAPKYSITPDSQFVFNEWRDCAAV